jgi:hypothetical protein
MAPPHSIAADLDRDDLVAGVLKARSNRRRRGQRDLVLGGPSTSEDRHAEYGHGVVVVGVLVVPD